MTDTGMVKITGRFKEWIAPRLTISCKIPAVHVCETSFSMVQSLVWHFLILNGSFRRLNSFEFRTQFSCFLQIFGAHPIAAEPNTRSWSSVMEVKTSLQCPSKIKWKHPAMASTRRIHGISMFTVAVHVSIKVQVFKTGYLNNSKINQIRWNCQELMEREICKIPEGRLCLFWCLVLDPGDDGRW